MDMLQSGGLTRDELDLLRRQIVEENDRQHQDAEELDSMLTGLNDIVKGMNGTRNELNSAKVDLEAKEADIDAALEDSKVQLYD